MINQTIYILEANYSDITSLVYDRKMRLAYVSLEEAKEQLAKHKAAGLDSIRLLKMTVEEVSS